MKNKWKLIVMICLVPLLMTACVNQALQHYNQGNTYTEQELWDEAIQEYTKAIELDINFAEAYNDRG